MTTAVVSMYQNTVNCLTKSDIVKGWSQNMNCIVVKCDMWTIPLRLDNHLLIYVINPQNKKNMVNMNLS